MEPVYTPIVRLALTLMKAMSWKVLATGIEHVPRTGPAVLATNHVGYLDFVFVGAAARHQGRLVRFMAKKEVFDHKISGPLMRGMKHVPVDRVGRAADAATPGGNTAATTPTATGSATCRTGSKTRWMRWYAATRSSRPFSTPPLTWRSSPPLACSRSSGRRRWSSTIAR